MSALGNLFVIFLVILSKLALILLAATGSGIMLSILCLALWFLPFRIIASPKNTEGFEKIALLLAMICLSWFASVFYSFFGPIKPKQFSDQFGQYEYLWSF